MYQLSLLHFVKKYKYKTLFFLFLLFIIGLAQPAYSKEHQKEISDFSEINHLLSILNLNQPGLEKVKASKNNPVQAATELLRYYRARTNVKHPVDKQSKAICWVNVPMKKILRLRIMP